MGCEYCCPPAPTPQPELTPLAPLSEKTSICQDSCCESDNAEPLNTRARVRKSQPSRNRMIAALLAHMRTTEPRIKPMCLTAAVAILCSLDRRFKVYLTLIGQRERVRLI